MVVTLLALLSLLCNHGNADLTTALSDSSVHVGDDVTFVCAYQFQNQTGDDDDDMDNYAMNYDFNLIHLSGFKPTIKEGHYTEQVVATVNITGGLTSVMGGEQVTSSAELQADYRKVTLTLHNVTFEDYGEYQCEIGDRGVFRGNVVFLKIIGPPRIIKDATVQHLSKFPARTCCVFESFPPPSMSTWTLPSGQTVLDARMAPSDWNQIVWSTNYLIPAYNSSHVGKYRCTVVNPFGRDSFEFLVNDDTFVRIEEDTDVVKLRVNDMKLVRCLAANLNASIPKEKYSFFWTLRSGQQNMTIANSSTQSVRTYLSFNISEGDSTSAMFVLVINHVDFSWDGELTCQMSVDGSNFTSTVRLQVTGLPDVESPINRFYTNLNTSQQIVCQVTSFPPPSEYSWRFALDHSNAHKFTTITAQPGKYQISVRDDINGHLMILTIFNINQSDIGIYQCSSTNELGESYDFVEIEFCDSGYTPMIGGIECKDINECKEFNDICDYLCKNLNGSYTCECPEGRALNSDKRSCLALDYEELQERIGQGIGLGAGAVLVLVLVFGGVAYYYRYRSKKKRRDSFMNIVHERAKKTRSQIMLKQSQSDITIKRLSERKFPLDQTRINEFPRERLRVLDQLGKGEFGCVCMAEALNIIGTGKWEVVAVKMAHESATDLEKVEFVRELDLMSRIPRHLNVVNYLGCCSLIDPVMIIMEYISGGDLQTFLRQRRRRDFFLELSSPQHNREHLSFGDDPRGHGVNHMSFINPGFTHDNQQQLNYQQSNNQQFNSPERNISTKKCLAPTRSADSVNYIKNSTSPHHRTDPAGHGSIQKKKNSAHRLRSDTISLIRIDSTSDTASSHGDDSLPDTPVRHSEINFSTSGGMSEPRSEPQPDCDVTDGSRQAEVRENDLHENGHRKLRLTNSCPTPSPVKTTAETVLRHFRQETGLRHIRHDFSEQPIKADGAARQHVQPVQQCGYGELL
ncbi:vascular endothelial growth factor receptor 2-like [Physella acuta]|uniref:vascular endothelial growth factor receptor 2-like n=1 Tax=Physella acuta TaxID=109671 RepID=UPI0027DB199B|nr:vascular endothelial growth factor receptor 2-like [Physella acuta]